MQTSRSTRSFGLNGKYQTRGRDRLRSDPETLRFVPRTADDALSAFVSARRCLFGIAYRILGSAAEAEDILQDVWLRWHATDSSKVQNAAAFLATATTRLSINLAQSARVRREVYFGASFPEPADDGADPHSRVQQAQALESAALLLLERLLPTERAAYLLREAFNYPYPQIAGMLRVSEVNCRQLVTRARKHIADERRVPVSSMDQRGLLTDLIAAARAQDTGALARLLAAVGQGSMRSRTERPVRASAPRSST